MKRVHPASILMAVVAGAVLVPAVLLLATPPWNSRLPCMVQMRLHRWTGIQLHRFPDHYTGTWVLWDESGWKRAQHEYRGGERHGRWVTYHPDGHIRSSCEYRDGEPWDGICQIYDTKGWLGEYRQGKPWNGCLPVRESPKPEVKLRYFVDGLEFSAADYRTHHGLPTDAWCFGLHHGTRTPGR